MSKSVSVLIVNYFKSKDIAKYINTLLSQGTDIETEVLIWDNSCNTDESQRLRKLESPIISLTVSDQNIGYTKAVNKLASLSKSEYIFLMSPDIDPLSNDLLSQLIEFSVLHENCVVSPRQVNRDGTVPSIARRFPTSAMMISNRIQQLTGLTRIYSQSSYHYSDSELATDLAVDWIQSSALLIKRTLWECIRGLDERYFIFMADVELGKALRRKGYEMRICMKTTVSADGIRASNVSPLKTISDILNRGAFYWHIRDALKYFVRRIYD